MPSPVRPNPSREVSRTRRLTRRLRGAHGQASVELVALFPLIVVLAALLWQTVLAGEAVWLVSAAARAGARAEAVGQNALAAARRELPGGLRPGLSVDPGRDGAVAVHLAVPMVLGVGRLGSVSARARFAPQR